MATNGNGGVGKTGTTGVKKGLPQMLKGGIIMDVVNEEQARIAEEAGACAVMALERVPADIRKDGGVARMADPKVGGYSTQTMFPQTENRRVFSRCGYMLYRGGGCYGHFEYGHFERQVRAWLHGKWYKG